jgi:virginiamycin A acetyltransferase
VAGAPDPTVLHPVAGQDRVVYLRPLVTDPRIEVGEYTYYDDPDDALGFERNAFLYAYGPERLIIGRYCAIASGVRFVMPGANHADLGPSTFPFGIFGEPWAELTMDLVMGAPSRGDTVVGSDVMGARGAASARGLVGLARGARDRARPDDHVRDAGGAGADRRGAARRTAALRKCTVLD